jgi:hypothetical protein
MLHVSGANKSLAIVLKVETNKKPATIARFDRDNVDSVTIEIGSQKTVVPLFGDDSLTYHDTHAILAELLDKALYNGPYAPTVLLAKGYISENGFSAMAKNVIEQEASDRDITLDEGFDFAGAMKSAIVSRSYGKTPVLSLPASADS